jgi:endonuclease/exonuclease/phosphatase family metal-dependent hydrolase
VRLRVATYNVRSFRSGADVVAGALGPERPDVAMFQECGSRRRLRRFAGTLEMEVASSHRPFSRVRNAVLYRPDWRLTRVDVRELSRKTRTLRRGFVAVHLRRMGVPLIAVSAHLGLAPGERRRHAQELTDYLAGAEGHVVVGADLNEGPEGPAARWVCDRLFDLFTRVGRGDGATFPAHEPTARIDFLLAGEGVSAVASWVPASAMLARASDHLPVLADVDVVEEP